MNTEGRSVSPFAEKECHHYSKDPAAVKHLTKANKDLES